MEKYFKIAYKAGEFSFELESSEMDWIEKKEKEYLKKLPDQTEMPLNVKKSKDELVQKPKALSDISESMTINEFYNQHVKKLNIKSRTQIALFFVYYMETIQKRNDIKSGEIVNCFKAIHYPNWNKLNAPDLLLQNKKKAFLNNVNGYWSLTITGQDYVLNTLADENS
jgi:hypothetical protein